MLFIWKKRATTNIVRPRKVKRRRNTDPTLGPDQDPHQIQDQIQKMKAGTDLEVGKRNIPPDPHLPTVPAQVLKDPVVKERKRSPNIEDGPVILQKKEKSQSN